MEQIQKAAKSKYVVLHGFAIGHWQVNLPLGCFMDLGPCPGLHPCLNPATPYGKTHQFHLKAWFPGLQLPPTHSVLVHVRPYGASPNCGARRPTRTCRKKPTSTSLPWPWRLKPPNALITLAPKAREKACSVLSRAESGRNPKCVLGREQAAFPDEAKGF